MDAGSVREPRTQLVEAAMPPTEYVPHSGPIVTRAEAKAQGLRFFFTGKPCKHGHLSQRYTSQSGCVACTDINAARWLSENLERRKDYEKRYREDNREKITAKTMRWRAANRERWDEAARAWLDANKEHVAGLRKAYHEANRDKRAADNRAWRERNGEHIKAVRDEWLAANPLKARIYAEKRRALKQASGGAYTTEQIEALAKRQKHKCAECKCSIRDKYDIDHIMPLSKGGSNDIKNIQLLCEPCNQRKHNKHPLDWARLNGRLL